MSERGRSGYLAIGSGPSEPCHVSPPKSTSDSSRRNAGRTSTRPQPGLPRAAHASKSAAAPHTAKRVSHDVPPSSRPRRKGFDPPDSPGSDVKPQSAGFPRRQPSGAAFASGSPPASRRSTDADVRSATRRASTHPAAPAPTVTMSASFAADCGASVRVRSPGRSVPTRTGRQGCAPARRHDPDRVGAPPPHGPRH